MLEFRAPGNLDLLAEVRRPIRTVLRMVSVEGQLVGPFSCACGMVEIAASWAISHLPCSSATRGMIMRQRSSKYLLAALALALNASPADAQRPTTGTVAGRITDRVTQAPVPGANIEAVTTVGRVVASAVTDADGAYRLVSVPAGAYSIVVTVAGYHTVRIPNVRVLAGQTSVAGSRLTSHAFPLNPLIVSVSKHMEKALEAPASVWVVAGSRIAERPTTTVADHLRSTAGVDVMTTGVQSAIVATRGFNSLSSGKLHALTDYRIAALPSLRMNFLHFIPQTDDDLERIEVVIGPGAALFGPNTAHGVVHLITKSPLDQQGTALSLAGGERRVMHATFRTAQKFGDNLGLKISGQYLSAREYDFRDDDEDENRAALPTTDDSLQVHPLFPPGMPLEERKVRAARIADRDFDIKRWSGDVRLDWRATETLTAVLSAGMSEDNSIELTGVGAGQFIDWMYTYAQARANYKGGFAQSYLNVSDAGESFQLRNGAPITDRSRVWVSQLQHVANLGVWQTFTYGADYIATMPVTGGTIHGSRENDDEYNEYGVYLQSETRLHRLFDVVLAARYDRHSELEDAVFSPRVGLVFKPSENHTFRATYNRAFSTPTSLNLFFDADVGGLGRLGRFGFRTHGQAPGTGGISLHTPDGSLQIRTPFAGDHEDPATYALRNISLSSVYDYQFEALARSVPAARLLAAEFQTFKADAAFGQLRLVLDDPRVSKEIAFANDAVSDVAPIAASTTSAFELGYRGVLGGKLLLTVDVWLSKHRNFGTSLVTATPLVRVDSAQLRQFLVDRLTPVVGAPTANTLARGMAQLPGGVIASAQTLGTAAPLILTYVNLGDVDLGGLDVSATALLSSSWQLSVTGSLVSDDYFKLPLGATGIDSTVVALNAPRMKAMAALSHQSPAKAFSGEVRLRHTSEFPANSAGYVGLKCADASAKGECIKAFTIVDLIAGYRLPLTGASLQLSVTNLLNEDHQSFIGTPVVKRLAQLRLQYEF